MQNTGLPLIKAKQRITEKYNELYHDKTYFIVQQKRQNIKLCKTIEL